MGRVGQRILVPPPPPLGCKLVAPFCMNQKAITWITYYTFGTTIIVAVIITNVIDNVMGELNYFNSMDSHHQDTGGVRIHPRSWRKYRVTSYTWPCVSGTLYKVSCPVYACRVAYHWTSHFLQGTRKTQPCLPGQVV